MKTKPLREHLLDRSRAADVEDGLAAMRARVLAATAELSASRPRAGQNRAGPLDALRTFWRELVVPCRGLWATLAAAWVAVLFFNATERPVGGEDARPGSSDLVAWAGSWRDRQRLLAELRGYRAGRAPAVIGAPDPDASMEGKSVAPAPKPLGWRDGVRFHDSAWRCA